MTEEAFKDRLNSQPFREFYVKTADGDTFRVFHPDYAMISPKATEVIIYDRDNHFRVMSMNMIVSLEPVKASEPRKGKR